MGLLQVEFVGNDLRLSGEIDLASAGAFEDALISAIDTIDVCSSVICAGSRPSMAQASAPSSPRWLR